MHADRWALVFCLLAIGTQSQSVSVDGMSITLDEKSQTVSSLTVAAADIASGKFEFMPANQRYYLGDINMRVRDSSSPGAPFTSLTTSTKAAGAVPMTPAAGEIAAANLTGTLNSKLPLSLERRYSKDASAEGNGVKMSFVLKNTGSTELEIGAWGAAMIFETKDNGGHRDLDGMAGNCSMVDASINGGHSWVSATRMTGTGPVLMVVAETGGMEAWRAIGNGDYELTGHSLAYAENEWAKSSQQWVNPTNQFLPAGGEATFAYRIILAKSVRTKDEALAKAGFAVLQSLPGYVLSTDMNGAQLHMLPPRSSSIVKVSSSPPDALSTTGQPAPLGTNGFYSVGLKGLKMGRANVTVTYSDNTTQVANYMVLPPLNEHVKSYGQFQSKTAWYSNVSDPFGRGNSVFPWNRELNMHIGVGPWDNGYEDNRIYNNGLSDEAGAGANVGFAAKVSMAPVADEVAVLDLYITSTLYGVKKGLPFGASLQCVAGEEGEEAPSCGPPSIVGPTTDGIMASMFWVPTSPSEEKMPGYDYNSSWFCTKPNCPPGWPGWRWDQPRAASLGRAYNYAHQSSVYLGMYMALRGYDKLQTVAAHPAKWYLNRAYKTIVGMWNQASWYSHQGLMDGTNFRTILYALQDEGMAIEAADVTDMMRNRTLVGVTNKCRYYVMPGKPMTDRGPAYPGCHWYLPANTTTPWVQQTGLPGSGSEFAWDTTGQEEAYVWGAYFNSSYLADSALNQILAYTPMVANWAWHGSAYGMGDFGNNGFIRPNERVLQHYRSGLNSIPTTEAFLDSPNNRPSANKQLATADAEADDRYLLRLAVGSITGVLTNIDSDGAASMGFHGDHAHLFFDPCSGDHGLAFYGHTHNTGSFLVYDPPSTFSGLGWLCYLCDSTTTTTPSESTTSIVLKPRDSYRRRVFIAPLGLQLVSEGGTFAEVHVTVSTSDDASPPTISALTVIFDAVGTQPLTQFRLRLNDRWANSISGAEKRDFHVPGISRTNNVYVIPASATNMTMATVEWTH